MINDNVCIKNTKKTQNEHYLIIKKTQSYERQYILYFLFRHSNS